MKIVLIQVGKTDREYLVRGIDEFVKRIKRFTPFETETIPDLRNRRSLSMSEQIKKEAELISSKLLKGDHLILLDERGKRCTSIEFSELLDALLQSSAKRIVFVVGGPYGLHDSLRSSARLLLSLSDLTFSHQLVRLLFVEQLYRGLSILGGLPYHNQ